MGVKTATQQSHGLLTDSRHGIEAAPLGFIAPERYCRQQLLVEATGDRVVVPPERRATAASTWALAVLPADPRAPGRGHDRLSSFPHVLCACQSPAAAFGL
jgi:hypothetical protein